MKHRTKTVTKKTKNDNIKRQEGTKEGKSKRESMLNYAFFINSYVIQGSF